MGLTHKRERKKRRGGPQGTNGRKRTYTDEQRTLTDRARQERKTQNAKLEEGKFTTRSLRSLESTEDTEIRKIINRFSVSVFSVASSEERVVIKSEFLSCGPRPLKSVLVRCLSV
jgi:uncharacterized membrane protein